MRCANVLNLFEHLSADMLKLDKLSLALIKRELNQRIKILKDQLNILNGMQAKFQDDFYALKSLDEKRLPYDGLVPLTNRVLVPGKIEDIELICHAGDGYFITKSLPEALDRTEERWKGLEREISRNQLVTILLESIVSFANQILFIRRRMDDNMLSYEKKAKVENSLLEMYKDTISIFKGDVPKEFFDKM